MEAQLWMIFLDSFWEFLWVLPPHKAPSQRWHLGVSNTCWRHICVHISHFLGSLLIVQLISCWSFQPFCVHLISVSFSATSMLSCPNILPKIPISLRAALPPIFTSIALPSMKFFWKYCCWDVSLSALAFPQRPSVRRKCSAGGWKGSEFADKTP